MAKLNLYSVRDLKNNFAPPYVDTSDESAKRTFALAVEDAPVVKRFPADYELYRVGTFDPENGHVEPVELPVFLIRGDEVD